jgi:hypothetical protein
VKGVPKGSWSWEVKTEVTEGETKQFEDPDARPIEV